MNITLIDCPYFLAHNWRYWILFNLLIKNTVDDFGSSFDQYGTIRVLKIIKKKRTINRIIYNIKCLDISNASGIF